MLALIERVTSERVMYKDSSRPQVELSQPTYHLLNSAGHWFLESGIQQENGGVARYYRSDLRKNARISTEITGYAVSALLYLYQRLGDNEYLEFALHAARFLTRTAWDPQVRAFPFEFDVDGEQPQALAYFFDTGIVIRGLLAAWRVSGEAEFRDIAIAAGHAMLTDFYAGEGIIPILTMPGKLPLPNHSNWSSVPGCYQLKSALAWYELFEVTGVANFLRAYESAVDDALTTEAYFLPGATNSDKIMDRLHAYAYFLEGLLPVLGREECAACFRQGIDRIAGYLQNISPLFSRSDVYAQLLRLRLYGEILGVIPVDPVRAEREAAQVAGFQVNSEDTAASNGFYFGRRCGELLPYVNPASTVFCLQALALWDDYKSNALKGTRQTLI
jgi:hypothetical protein